MKIRQVGRATDPQAELQFQEIRRVVNNVLDDELPYLAEELEKEKRKEHPDPVESPDVPSGLRVIPVFLGFYVIWDTAPYGIVDGYYLEFSTSEDGETWSEFNWQRITLPNISTFIHTVPDVNLYYRYKLAAFNRLGESVFGEIVYAGRPGAPSYSEELIADFNWENWLEHSEPFANVVADVTDNKHEISAIGQKADEVSSSVARLRRGIPIYSGVAQGVESLNGLAGIDANWETLLDELGMESWEGLHVELLTGEGAGQIRTIEDYAANLLTLTEGWDIKPTTGDEFEIFAYQTEVMSTIQQNAGAIAQRVVVVDEEGNVIPKAQIVVSGSDEHGNVYISADDIILDGSVTYKKLNVVFASLTHLKKDIWGGYDDYSLTLSITNSAADQDDWNVFKVECNKIVDFFMESHHNEMNVLVGQVVHQFSRDGVNWQDFGSSWESHFISGVLGQAFDLGSSRNLAMAPYQIKSGHIMWRAHIYDDSNEVAPFTGSFYVRFKRHSIG